MGKPKGDLTAQQLEIMDVVWKAERVGATVAEIWRELSHARKVARTTVLTMVTRLHKRGWLLLPGKKGVNRFRSAVSRKKASSLLASDFVSEFFDGSASELVQSLIGSKKIKPGELDRIRKLIDEAEGKK